VFICCICAPGEIDFFRAFCTKNLTSDGNSSSNADSLCYAAIVSTAERFLVSKISKLTRPEVHQQVATVNHLCMVDHVKFLMHLRLYGCCSIIIGGLQNIGARTPMIDVHRLSQRSADMSEWIHYQWTSAVAGIVFQSLTVVAIQGPRLKLLLQIFAWQNLDTTPATSQRKYGMRKILAACHSGGPFPDGGPTRVRTVPRCLIVNPALSLRFRIQHWVHNAPPNNKSEWNILQK